MKNYFASFLLMLAVAGFSSCRDESKLPAPKLSGSVPLIIPVVSSDSTKNHFDYASARQSIATNTSRPVFEFTFDLDNSRDKKVKAVEVYRTFSRGNLVVGPRVLHGTYTSFPVTISVNSQEALAGLKRVATSTTLSRPYLADILAANRNLPNGLAVGDAIVFTFEYILEDDSRVILTPLTDSPTLGPSPTGTPPPSPAIIKVVANTTQVNAPYAAVATFRN